MSEKQKHAEVFSNEKVSSLKTLTDTNDFLFADSTRVDFCDKLLDGNVRVLIHVWINVGLQRLELI